MNNKKRNTEPCVGIKSSILDAIRQWWYPVEFRIALPCPPSGVLQEPETPEPSEPPIDGGVSDRFAAQVATCLWYLKTKHFKRNWEDDGTAGSDGDDDPRVRRAVHRLNRGIDALKENGIEVYDPTNQRYVQGSEGTMRPTFQPTAGFTTEIVTETITPVMYRNDRLIQRGEVFVAVPLKEPTSPPQPVGAADTVGDEGDHEDRPDGDIRRAVCSSEGWERATERAAESPGTPHDDNVTPRNREA